MKTFQTLNSLSKNQDVSTDPIAEDAILLKNGMWPRSYTLWLAAFYMALFIIRPWEKLFPSWQAFYPERLYAICMILAVFFSGDKQFRMTWQSVTVVLFFASIAFSGFFAYNPSLTWDILYGNLSLAIFYFILLLVIRTRYDLVFIVLSYIAIMCIYLGKTQWEFFLNGQHRYDMGVIRMTGIETTFGGPNSLAMSIVVSLPFLVFLWKYRTIIADTWPTVWQTRLKRGLILYGILAVSSIVLTNSRSGFVGFLVYVAILMFGGRGIGKKIGYIIVGLLILSVAWFLVPEENKGRYRTIWAPEDGPANAQESANGRGEGFKAGMDMLKKHPITGVGAGNFVIYRSNKGDGVPLQSHNLEGQLLGEMGYLGGLAFLMMIGATFANCRNTAQLSKFQDVPTMLLLGDLSRACSISLFLLIFLGTFGHNLYRYNWLWLAAFSVLALQFQRDIVQRNEGIDVYN